MEAMLASDIDYTIFFYNPNIHPEKEYLLRKDENVRFAEKHGRALRRRRLRQGQTGSNGPKAWSGEPERGIRCTMCFDMRFERTGALSPTNTAFRS